MWRRNSTTGSDPGGIRPVFFWDRELQAHRAQPKRIREVHRIPARKPVQVQPAREPDEVFLGEAPGDRVIVPVAAVQQAALVPLVLEQPAQPRVLLVRAVLLQVCRQVLRGPTRAEEHAAALPLEHRAQRFRRKADRIAGDAARIRPIL